MLHNTLLSSFSPLRQHILNNLRATAGKPTFQPDSNEEMSLYNTAPNSIISFSSDFNHQEAITPLTTKHVDCPHSMPPHSTRSPFHLPHSMDAFYSAHKKTFNTERPLLKYTKQSYTKPAHLSRLQVQKDG